MPSLRNLLDRVAPHFEEGGRLEHMHAAWEAVDTLLYSPGHVTRTASHVRDGLDLKRMMSLVIVALLPCVLVAVYNTGYQANLAISLGASPLDDWQSSLFVGLGGRFDPGSPFGCFFLGAFYFVPVLLVCYAVGLGIEIVSAGLRGHEVSEGFLVTGMLIPLTLPATIPLWQVALGTSFGVIFGKEVFGGTGMNFLNPALVCACLPLLRLPRRHQSRDTPWIAADFLDIDSFTGATLTVPGGGDHARRARDGCELERRLPGMDTGLDGRDFGARLPDRRGLPDPHPGRLVADDGRRDPRDVSGHGCALQLGGIGDATRCSLSVFHWHMVLGGWALGAVFMATDPVSSSFTDGGRWVYGFLGHPGILTVLIRTVNPAYPEGMMLAILFMNMFAPLIDYFALQRNIRRRLARNAAVVASSTLSRFAFALVRDLLDRSCSAVAVGLARAPGGEQAPRPTEERPRGGGADAGGGEHLTR